MKHWKDITDSIIYRAVCEECTKKKLNSELSCGMYCAARLRFSKSGQFLIIALDKRGRILNEDFFIPEEFNSLPESCEFFKDFAVNSVADSLIIAVTFDKSDKTVDTKMIRFYASCACLISKSLCNCGVLLKGFYLVTDLNFENAAPPSLRHRQRRQK